MCGIEEQKYSSLKGRFNILYHYEYTWTFYVKLKSKHILH